MSEVETIVINDFFITRLANLKAIYQITTVGLENETAEEIVRGWKEWPGLNDESKKFVLDYLNI